MNPAFFQSLLDDPLYIGLREKRDNSALYDQLIDELMIAAVARYANDIEISIQSFSIEGATSTGLKELVKCNCMFRRLLQAFSCSVIF